MKMVTPAIVAEIRQLETFKAFAMPAQIAEVSG
jgi:hypothetical protein